MNSDRLDVGPLSLHDTNRLLWARFDLHLSRPSLLKVHQTSGGNPFLVLELGRSVAEGTLTLDGGPLTLPPRVSDLVDQRLARLPGSVRDTLAAVAAMGAPEVTVLGRCRRASWTTSRSLGSATWSGSTATASGSPIPCWPRRATRRCPSIGGVSCIDDSLL